MPFISSIFSLCKATYLYFIPAHKFELVTRIYGHKDSIFAVDTTRLPDGKILVASAGECPSSQRNPITHPHKGKDGVRIWEMPSAISVPTPEPTHPKRGAPTSLAWGTDERDTSAILVCGTVNGYLCIMRRVHSVVRLRVKSKLPGD